MAVVGGRALWGSLATSWLKGKVKMTQSPSPAHDLMGEQHSAHFRVLVLSLIDNGLGERESAQAHGEECPNVGGETDLSLEKIMPSKSLQDTEGCRARAGSLAPQSRITDRVGNSGMRSTDSICPQAAPSRSISA